MAVTFTSMVDVLILKKRGDNMARIPTGFWDVFNWGTNHTNTQQALMREYIDTDYFWRSQNVIFYP